MSKRDLLIEIGTEELPPKALLSLSKAFCNEVSAGLKLVSLEFDSIEPFATPRRLAMVVRQLDECQPDLAVEKFGPAVQAAFDEEGNPTKAAQGFARSCGVGVEELEQKQDGKASKLYFSSLKPGLNTVGLLEELIANALKKLPIPKRMRWGSSHVEFVRPAHWLVILFGEELVPAKILGLESQTNTHGHRFHHPQAITVNSAGQYETLLANSGFVIPSFQKRMDMIRDLLEKEADKLQAKVEIDQALLQEVSALVEWPVALTGKFDPSYLSVPQEALISSLKEHQKCFHLVDSDNTMLPAFITISNLQSKDPAQVIAGNEKVIGPRLADAAFFFSQDKKSSLSSRREKLKSVIFQKDLGTLFDKSERVRKLSYAISGFLNISPQNSDRAAELAKCDLLTNMVSEFPSLQGVMGCYYAQADNENEEAAIAIMEQYFPRFSGDKLPTSKTGAVVALAERLDTISGLYAIGQPPTGSKDPFALRRSALGVLRILIELELTVDLPQLVQVACFSITSKKNNAALEDQILSFMYERLRALYSDQKISTEIFLAVDAVRPASPFEFDLRVKAVSDFIKKPEAQHLAAANKRVANILSKLETLPAQGVDPSLLVEPAEQSLANILKEKSPSIQQACDEANFNQALNVLSTLQTPIDDFFDQVMVNTDDDATRYNRQSLLLELRQLFLLIADIAYLQPS